MSSRGFSLFLLLGLSVGFAPEAAWAQHKAPAPQSPKVRKQRWDVAGRVTTLNGDPLSAATVRIDVGAGAEFVRTLNTNLKGDFETEYSLEPNSYKSLSVKVTATKEGYLDGLETADFEAPGKARRVDLVLREASEDPFQLAPSALIGNLAPRLRELPEGDSVKGPDLFDYRQAARELSEKQDSALVVPLLVSIAQRQPKWVSCHALQGLSLLSRGSWSSAIREFTLADKLNTSEPGKTRRSEPPFILGVLETWRGHLRRAAAFFLQALEVDPSNPTTLQELGRAFVLSRNMKAADQYLKKAIKAGASTEAHLLRARALLEEGIPEEAQAEMQAYLGGRRPRDLPRPLRGQWSEMENRIELESAEKVPSVVDQPLKELIEAIPELKTLEPAQKQDELTPILRKVGEGVNLLFQNFPNTSSLEEVRQERLHSNGKLRSSVQRQFQYLLLSQLNKGELLLEEYRTNDKGQRAEPSGAEGVFMVTAGFASLPLHFHPTYQYGSAYRYLGHQNIDGHNTHVIAFAQRPETATLLESFRVNHNPTSVLLQGEVWVDSGTFQIIRMRTDLLKTAVEIGLQRQTTDVHFEEVHIAETGSKLWLPNEVVVTLDWNGKAYRNLHRYSDFRLFNVQTKERQRTAHLAP